MGEMNDYWLISLKQRHVWHLKCLLICFQILNELETTGLFNHDGGGTDKAEQVNADQEEGEHDLFSKSHHNVDPSCIPNESALILPVMPSNTAEKYVVFSYSFRMFSLKSEEKHLVMVIPKYLNEFTTLKGRD